MYGFAVKRRELACDLGGGACDFVDEGKGASKQDCDHDVSNYLSEKVVSFGEVTVLPDNVGGLRSLFEFKWQIEKCLFSHDFFCDNRGVLFFKSNESRCWSG